MRIFQATALVVGLSAMALAPGAGAFAQSTSPRHFGGPGGRGSAENTAMTNHEGKSSGYTEPGHWEGYLGDESAKNTAMTNHQSQPTGQAEPGHWEGYLGDGSAKNAPKH